MAYTRIRSTESVDDKTRSGSKLLQRKNQEASHFSQAARQARLFLTQDRNTYHIHTHKCCFVRQERGTLKRASHHEKFHSPKTRRYCYCLFQNIRFKTSASKYPMRISAWPTLLCKTLMPTTCIFHLTRACGAQVHHNFLFKNVFMRPIRATPRKTHLWLRRWCCLILRGRWCEMMTLIDFFLRSMDEAGPFLMRLDVEEESRQLSCC